MNSVPPTKVRSLPLTTHEHTYHQTAAAAATVAALAVWIALWILNGYFTMQFVVNAGRLLHLSWTTPLVGWAIHLVVSLIELHLWRLRGLSEYVQTVVIGVLDVGTSALGLLFVAATLGLQPTAFPVMMVCAIIAGLIAALPERMIVRYGVALWRMAR